MILNKATYNIYGKIFDITLICFIMIIVGINCIFISEDKYAVTLFMGIGYVFIQKLHSIYIRIFFKKEIGERVPILFSRVGHYIGIIFFIITIILMFLMLSYIDINELIFFTSLNICGLTLGTSMSADLAIRIVSGGGGSAANYKTFYISRLK